jgi:hypothetical protein
MAQQQTQSPPVVDPDATPETLCDGRINIHWHANLATLTFTHSRPIAAELFSGEAKIEDVVRARVVMSVPNIVALRDLLNKVIKDGSGQAPAGGASSDTVH